MWWALGPGTWRLLLAWPACSDLCFLGGEGYSGGKWLARNINNLAYFCAHLGPLFSQLPQDVANEDLRNCQMCETQCQRRAVKNVKNFSNNLHTFRRVEWNFPARTISNFYTEFRFLCWVAKFYRLVIIFKECHKDNNKMFQSPNS